MTVPKVQPSPSTPVAGKRFEQKAGFHTEVEENATKIYFVYIQTE
jgi:hypothetical protein